MRAQQHAVAFGVHVREIERVVHGARRVRFSHVERGEIVPIVLDLGSGGHREAKVGKDFSQFVHHLADRMDAAARRLRGRQGKVEPFGRQLALQLLGLEEILARGQRIGDCRASALNFRGLHLAFFGRHLAQCLHQRRDAALLAQIFDAQRLERVGILRLVDTLQGIGLHRGQVGHGNL